jgi:hypothetical protein
MHAKHQQYTESVADNVKHFRETRNKCYSLTIREKDLADLALAGLSSNLQEKLEESNFADINQVMQPVVLHENQANRSQSRFREGSKDKERSTIGTVEEDEHSEDEGEVCVTEWVDVASNKPITCSFLKPGPRKKDEMRFTFDIMKCEKLFGVLLQNNIIKLKGGHVIPTAEQLAQKIL